MVGAEVGDRVGEAPVAQDGRTADRVGIYVAAVCEGVGDECEEWCDCDGDVHGGWCVAHGGSGGGESGGRERDFETKEKRVWEMRLQEDVFRLKGRGVLILRKRITRISNIFAFQID